jgi:subtilisin family serine protease
VFAADALRTLEPVPRLDELDREWAWGGSSGRGVKVAIVDSGVDAGHPAIGNVDGYVAISEGTDGTLVYDTDPHEDGYGHGTACAGIVRAAAPDCEIYSVKVLGPKLSGRGPVFAAGLKWALKNGIQVCNLSLSTSKKEFFGVLHDLADKAYFSNVMLVASANNLPVVSYPATYASVFSVASHDVPDPYLFYYNAEPPVEFGAHGMDVRVAWLNGGWSTVTGNSFATPHVTGVVAKILGKHPGLTTFQMKAVLRALAANVSRGENGPVEPGDGSPGRHQERGQEKRRGGSS